MMRGDGGIDQIAAEGPKPRQGAILVCAGEPAVADHVGDQDRRDFPGLAHGVDLPPPRQTSTKTHPEPLVSMDDMTARQSDHKKREIIESRRINRALQAFLLYILPRVEAGTAMGWPQERFC